MKHKKELKRRIMFINSLFVCCVAIITIRLANIQIGSKSDEYVYKALNQYNFQYRTSNLNYRVLDDKNNDLIQYQVKYFVEIKSNIFKNFNNNIEKERVFTFISILKNFNENFNLLKKFEENINYNFKFEVDKHTFDKLKTLGEIKGIHLYEYNELSDKEAWSIENIFIKEIAEKSTEDNYHEYINNNKYPVIDFINSASGEKFTQENNNNFKFTINNELQNGIEEILNNSKYEKFDSIAVAISEVSTGKVKALTQKNEFNPNIMLGSTGIGYVPGSIFKLVVAESAIDSGIFSDENIFSCGNNRYDLCKGKDHGDLNISGALAVSCNNIFAEIGSEVGWEYMLNYAENQGLFDKVLGFSNLREVSGSYAEPKEYEDGPLFLSMGQNMLIEPLQSLGIINTILNNGIYRKINLVDQIIDENGNIQKSFDYPSYKILKDSTADIMKYMLRNTVENGTGKNIYFNNVETGVKTGTSERFNGNNYVSDGWVIGYFKHRNKYYSMSVFVENINEDGQYGGNTAGPIFKDIVEYFIKNF